MKATQVDRTYRAVLQQHATNKRAEAAEKKEAEQKNQPVFVEQLTEHVLIEIPGSVLPRELPAALAAIHFYKKTAFEKAAAWSSMVKNYKRELTLNIDIVCDEVCVQERISALLEVPVFYEAPKDPYSYDMYHRFDSIKSFRANGKFHASSAYGICLGCEAQSLFEIPVEKIIKNVEGRQAVDILVIDNAHDDYKEVWEWIGSAVPNLQVSRLVPYLNPLQSMVAAINDASLVVGPLSMFTYLAACMHKPVFEFYPENLSRNWLSKWSSPNYSMYITDKPDKDVTIRGVSYLWQTAKSKREAVLA